jgi:hypothetical protein
MSNALWDNYFARRRNKPNCPACLHTGTSIRNFNEGGPPRTTDDNLPFNCFIFTVCSI